MDQRLKSCRQWGGFTGKHTGDQIAQMSTWRVVPDNEMTAAAFYRLRIVPKNGSTITYMNKLDPASDDQTNGPDSFSWRDAPGGYGEQNVREE